MWGGCVSDDSAQCITLSAVTTLTLALVWVSSHYWLELDPSDSFDAQFWSQPFLHHPHLYLIQLYDDCIGTTVLGVRHSAVRMVMMILHEYIISRGPQFWHQYIYVTRKKAAAKGEQVGILLICRNIVYSSAHWCPSWGSLLLRLHLCRSRLNPSVSAAGDGDKQSQSVMSSEESWPADKTGNEILRW